MIKGVNKRIVEVRLPESEYFERALVFLRSDLKSHESAAEIIADTAAAAAAASESDSLLAAAALKDISLLESSLPHEGLPRSSGRFIRRLYRIGTFAAGLFRLMWQLAVIVCAVGIAYGFTVN